MWIHLSKTEYGISYGSLPAPFNYMGSMLEQIFQEKEVEFPYREIEIGLIYNAKTKLPYYYRGKYMVKVNIAGEKDEPTLEELFRNIYQAFEIIVSKKKKEDNLDATKVLQVLRDLENELKGCDAREIFRKYEEICRHQSIEKRIREREERAQADIDKKRLIYDIRFYYEFKDVGIKYFEPYASCLCEKILIELRNRKFRLPGYSHLYIRVSDTFEEALLHAVRAEEWFVYGIAVYKDYKDYPNKSVTEKKQIVFNLIKEGLHDIAKIDKLDTITLNEVLDKMEPLNESLI